MAKKEIPDNNSINDDGEAFFDSSEYNTIILESEKTGGKKKKVNYKELIKLLTSENRQEKEDLLEILKKENAQHVLFEAIKNEDLKNDLAVLVAACWESGLDFSPYFLDFVNLAVETDDFMVCMEACTLLQEMEGKINIEDLDQAIKTVQEEIEEKNDKFIILSDLKMNLLDRKAAMPKESDDL